MQTTNSDITNFLLWTSGLSFSRKTAKCFICLAGGNVSEPRENCCLSSVTQDNVPSLSLCAGHCVQRDVCVHPIWFTYIEELEGTVI